MTRVTVEGRPGWRWLWAVVEPGVCRSCGAAILWCRTHNGKLVPVNPPAVPAVATVAHWTTCPEAAAWRRDR